MCFRGQNQPPWLLEPVRELTVAEQEHLPNPLIQHVKVIMVTIHYICMYLAGLKITAGQWPDKMLFKTIFDRTFLIFEGPVKCLFVIVH